MARWGDIILPHGREHLRSPLQALEERVGGILMRLEQELDDVEKTIGERLHVIDLDNDGLISKEELEQVSFATMDWRPVLDIGRVPATL